jgi:uncharacterized protein YcfL
MKPLCKIGIHNYEITQLVDRKGQHLCFRRACNRCEKQQELKRPEKYHPTKWVWVSLVLMLLVGCSAEKQTIQSAISFKIDGQRLNQSWQNFTAGSSQIVAEASDSARIFAVTINRSHQYDQTKVELTTIDGKLYRANGDFTIKSKQQGNLITADFYGKLISGTDTIFISDGTIQYE